MLGDSLQEFIDGIEYMYYVTNTSLYGDSSVRRGGWILEDNAKGDITIEYVRNILVAELIIKNENRTWARYIPQFQKAVDAILSHSRKVDLEPDEWPVMIEIAQRVKNGLPNIKIVPDGQD